MPGRSQFAVQQTFVSCFFGEPFWNGGGLRKTRSQLRLNFLLLFPAKDFLERA